MLDGEEGYTVKKSMEILVALGNIYGAEKLVKIGSVQVAGVSYHNLGDAGLEFLNGLAKDGKVKVLTTLNPAGMDLKDWKKLGIDEEFARKQILVIDVFKKIAPTVNRLFGIIEEAKKGLSSQSKEKIKRELRFDSKEARLMSFIRYRRRVSITDIVRYLKIPDDDVESTLTKLESNRFVQKLERPDGTEHYGLHPVVRGAF